MHRPQQAGQDRFHRTSRRHSGLAFLGLQRADPINDQRLWPCRGGGKHRRLQYRQLYLLLAKRALSDGDDLRWAKPRCTPPGSRAPQRGIEHLCGRDRRRADGRHVFAVCGALDGNFCARQPGDRGGGRGKIICFLHHVLHLRADGGRKRCYARIWQIDYVDGDLIAWSCGIPYFVDIYRVYKISVP